MEDVPAAAAAACWLLLLAGGWAAVVVAEEEEEEEVPGRGWGVTPPLEEPPVEEVGLWRARALDASSWVCGLGGWVVWISGWIGEE